MTASIGLSSAAHHNPYINVFAVNRFVQKLFADKVHFFKFLSTSDKSWIDQLKDYFSTASRLVVQASFEAFISIRKGKHPVLRTNAKPQQLIKHTKISYPIPSLVFFKFSCRTYQNGLNWGTSKVSKYLKK